MTNSLPEISGVWSNRTDSNFARSVPVPLLNTAKASAILIPMTGQVKKNSG